MLQAFAGDMIARSKRTGRSIWKFSDSAGMPNVHVQTISSDDKVNSCYRALDGAVHCASSRYVFRH